MVVEDRLPGEPPYDPAKVAEGYRMMAENSRGLAAYYRSWDDDIRAAVYERNARFDLWRAQYLENIASGKPTQPSPVDTPASF